ncbi:MAG: hypothetical protein OEQ39_06335 [Gammaproteobacteria bacterium]|nr:hypothetical protein [Gammaproteobacteria bacterium]MDH3466696.1 hypothetical protein [Gammaproteobacteria bacterium]
MLTEASKIISLLTVVTVLSMAPIQGISDDTHEKSCDLMAFVDITGTCNLDDHDDACVLGHCCMIPCDCVHAAAQTKTRLLMFTSEDIRHVSHPPEHKPPKTLV